MKRWYIVVRVSATISYKKMFIQSLLLVALLLGCSCKPANIVFLLTDDQDLLLGGTSPMAFTRTFLQEGGANLTNFFVNTPVCCPSRTTLLSGTYPHHWHTIGHPSCMHMNVTDYVYQERTIGVHMRNLGYATGMFGKFLNPSGMTPYCKGDHLELLPGFDTFLAMCNDNRYFKNEFTRDGKIFKTGSDPKDYLTSVIGNATLEFVNTSLSNGKPFFAYVAPHAPHVPATPAPWYEDFFKDRKAPRTENYNYSALDHHYVIRQQQPLSSKEGEEVDQLFRNRWRTLLSVDDIMVSLVDTIEKLGELDNTYFVWTSDHGFQLGQFRLPSCKLQPYEHDIRVPFYIRGPGIPRDSSFGFVAGMVDVAPTIVTIAGGSSEACETMDGKSFSHLLTAPDETSRKQKQAAWKDKIMLEYWSLGDVIRYDHYIDMPNSTYIGARLLNDTHNFLYAEFYDGVNIDLFDWPLERELFDITADPYQMSNLIGTAKEDPALVRELHDFIHWQVVCSGPVSCV